MNQKIQKSEHNFVPTNAPNDAMPNMVAGANQFANHYANNANSFYVSDLR